MHRSPTLRHHATGVRDLSPSDVRRSMLPHPYQLWLRCPIMAADCHMMPDPGPVNVRERVDESN
jgi:hypothetical protein